MKRNLHIDALKGIAILLVVLGHSIQFHTTDFDNNAIFRWIYSFHMPLFMFISGYLTFGKPINLKKKIQTLVIPFIAWHQVTYLIKNLSEPHSTPYIPFMTELFWSPDSGLWFLWVLFIIFCLFLLIQIGSRWLKKIPQEIIALGTYVLLQKIHFFHYGFALIRWHFLYFALGYFFVKNKRKWKLTTFAKMVIVITAPLIGITWSRADSPLFWPLLQLTAARVHLAGLPELLWFYTTVIVPLAGITFMYLVIPKKGGYLYKKLCMLGTLSLEIYAIQSYFTTIPGQGSQSAQIIGIFFLSLVCSVIIALFMHKSALLSLVFFGINPKKGAHKTLPTQ